MKYSLKDVIKSLPREKWKAESLWSRFFLRPLSFPPAWIALACGLSPNGMSWLSAFCALAGGILFGLTVGGVWPWVGIGLFFAFSVLDCADGNMARTLKTSNPWGSWTDAVGGYIAYTASLLSLGMAAERFAGPGIPGGLCIFLGGFSASANMLMRAAVQSSRVTALGMEASKAAIDRPPQSKPAGPGGEKWLSENLGITGIMAPAMGVGLYFGRLHWVLFFYSLLYGVGAVWVIFKLAYSRSK
jgi:phosphatidylglycerophosphate synthase